MSSKKTLAKNTGFLFSTEIIDKILSFFLIVLITRYLGDVGYGKYSFVFAFIGIATIISHMGLTTYIFREVAKDKSQTKKLVNNTVALKFCTLILVFIVAALIAKSWPKANEVFLAIIIVMVHEFFALFNILVRVIFKANEQNHYVLYSTIFEKTLALGLGSLVLIKGYGLYVLLLALTFARFSNTIFCYTVAFKKFVKIHLSFDLKLWMQILKNSVPFWLTLVFQRIYYRIDTMMLTAMKNFAVTGWYNAAATLTAALTFIPAVITQATFPAMSRFYHSKSKNLLKLLYEKSFYYMATIAIPISIGISLLAQRLILFIYKSEFIESGIALQVLSWSLIFVFINHVTGYLLNSINKQHLFTISAGFSAALNIIINLLLIPKFSYIGAGVATVITQLINFCLLYYFAMRNGYSFNIISVVYKPIIAGVIMGALISYIKFLPIICIVPIAAVVYFLILFIVGGIGKEEIELALSFFPSKR